MPAPYSAGSIFLQVLPSFRGVPEQIAREAREWDFSAAEKNLQDSISKGAEKGAREGGRKASAELGAAGDEAGKEYAGRFRSQLSKGVAAAQKELGALKVDVNDREARRKLDSLKKGFGNLASDITVGVDSGRAMLAFQKLEQRARDLQDASGSIEFRANIAGVIRDMETIRTGLHSLSGIDIEPELKVDRQLGLFERRLREGIRGALDSMPPIRLDDSEISTQIAELRERLHELGDVEIGVDVDSHVAFAELARIETELHSIADTAMDMDLRVNAAGALKTVAAVRTELESLSRITIEPEIDVDRQMGAFERGFKGAISNALKDLGSVDQKVTGTTLAERSVRDLRERLFNLGDLQIGVEISAETARNELRVIRDELERLQREHWSVDIDADTAAAAGQISGFLAALDAIDHEDIDVEVEVKGVASAIAEIKAMQAAAGHTAESLERVSASARGAGSSAQDGANSFRAFNTRVLGVAALGPLVVPVLGTIAAAIGALGPLAAAGAAGIGVLVLGLFGVGDAFKAMGDAQTKSGRDAEDHARAVRQAATSVEDAQRAVVDAERGVAEARESAAQRTQSAARNVENALRGVEDAERGLRSAQQDAAAAQRDLQRAREDAAEQLEDLGLRVRGGALDQRQATLDLRGAEADLAKARAEGAQGDDLEEYILRLDRAKLRVDQTKEANGDLAAEQAKWAKGGIEGSDGVVAAHERVQQAQERIADAERGMADAQRALADARTEQARAAVDGQRQIASAQRGVADAQRGLIEAQTRYTEVVNESSSAQEKLADTMSKLGPAGQDFVKFLDGLRPRFKGLRALAQEGLLPGLADWISSIVNFHGPLLEDTVGNISRAVGGMFSQFADSIRGEQFTRLFQMINRSGPTFIGMMGDVLTNLGEGVASLIVAMEPLAHLFGKWLVDATKRFSEWAGNLQGSTGLREFFDWVERVGPKVGDFFYEAADAIVAIATALAPFAEGLLDKFTIFFDWISEMDPNILGPIVFGIATLTVALQAIFGLTALAHSFKSAMHLASGALERFGLSGKFFGWVGILATALFVLYQNSESFREALRTLWNDVLEPFAGFVGDVLAPILETFGDLLGGHVELVAGLVGAYAGWKILTQVVGWVNGLRIAMLNLAAAQGLVAATGGIMTGPGNVARGLGGAAAGGLLGGLAGSTVAAGAIGLGAGLYLGHNNGQTGPVDANVQALMQGGAARDRYLASVERGRNQGFDADVAVRFLPFLASDQEEADYQNVQGADDVTRQYNDWFQGLGKLEQAQAKVAEWTNTLRSRQESGTATADELAAAHRRLEYWTGQVEKIQGPTSQAIDTTTQSMLDQQNATINLTDAEIAYSQARGDLKAAFTDYQKVMADVNATDEERRQAESQWTNQSRQTAEAARQVAMARLQGADAATQEAHGNAALLLDLERQKETYGSLPPQLEDLRVSLAATVDPAILAAEKFNALGLEIKEIPDRKTIILESATDEEIKKMQDLGFEVETLPDGTVKVTAKTDEAAKAIDELTAPRTLVITAAVKGTQVSKPGKNNDFATTPGVGGTQGGGFNSGPRAVGGVVWGPGTGTSDSILARLSNGEYVVKAAAVNKYGLPFMNALNSGRLEDTPGFSRGGRVSSPRVRGGLPAFAGGGFVASYGGQINLSGAVVPELAGWWVAALSTITQASNQAATHISRAFAGLRAALLGNFSDTHTRLTGIWGSMVGVLTGQSSAGRNGISGIFGNLRDLILGHSRGARDGSNSIFGQMRDWLSSRVTEMRDRATARASELVRNVVGHFGGMPRSVAGPVNRIIDAVLNNGLFKAFNSVISTLGLSEKLKIPPTKQVKLATGGRVPGSSPHPKADNIPAWLTAGEWVQPVDSVRYYGADFMEAIRKKQIPREVFSPIRRASGGIVDFGHKLQKMFPGVRISEHPAFGGVTAGAHVAGSQHYLGRAIDVNTRPGTSALEQRELDPMASLARSLGYRVLWMVKDHFNHLHVDEGTGKSLVGSVVGGVMDVLSDPVGMLRKTVNDALGSSFDGNPISRIMRDGSRKLVDLLADKVTGWAGSMFDFGAQEIVGTGRPANSMNERLVQQMAAARGWTGREWTELRSLIMGESGFNNLAQNPSSTAFGIFQFLNGTWAGTGISKTSDPRLQTEAGFRYIASRYGSPSRANAFKRSHNWYSEGGPVQDVDSATGGIVPDLHDTGGWVMPGLNVLMNRTNRPEPVINPQTLDALLTIADRGANGAALIGQYHQQVVSGSPRDAVDELLHRLDAASLGGRYGKRD